MKKLLSVLLVAIFITVAAASAAMAAELVGGVGKVVGDVKVMRDGGETVTAKYGTKLYLKDTVTTGATGRVVMNMKDGTRLMLGGKSSLVIREYMVKSDEGKRKSILGLLSGKLRCIVDKAFKAAGSKFEVHTPTAVAGVMGTDFGVEILPDGNTLEITINGIVNFGGTNVGSGNQGTGSDGNVTTGPASQTAVLTFVFATSTEADAAKAAVEAALALAAQVDAETDPAKKAALQRQLDVAMDNVINLLTPSYDGGSIGSGEGGEGGGELTPEQVQQLLQGIGSGGTGAGGGRESDPLP